MNCINCKSHIGYLHSEEATAPKPGHVAMCMQCGTVYMFDFDLHLGALTEEQVFQIAHDLPEVYTKILEKTKKVEERIRQN